MSEEKYKKIAFWPITILSFAFLFVFCATNFHLEIAESNKELFSVADNIIWAAFVLDYLAMLALSKNKLLFFKTHIPHLIVAMVPFLRVVRVGRIILLLANMLGMLKNRILVSIPVYTASSAALFILLGASAIYDAEYKAEGANINTRGDAFWWAGAIIFSYYYGERFAVTDEGRLYGFLLTLCGLSIIGTITATFAGWLISQVREIESDNHAILVKLEAMEKKLGVNDKNK